MTDKILSQWIEQHKNFFDTYGADHPLGTELARLIIADLCLSGAVMVVYKDFEWDLERYEITDAINFVASGLELVRSATFLMYSNYQPAPYFLLRSAINQFWFAYCAVTNKKFEESKGKGRRFYEIFNSEKPFLSRCEIQAEELEKITGNPIEGQSIVWDFNAILHGDARMQYLWLRASYQHPAFPSPVKLDKETLFATVLPLITHLRGCQELARVVLKSIFVNRDPELLWESWRNEAVVDNGDEISKLMDELETITERNLNILPQAPELPPHPFLTGING